MHLDSSISRIKETFENWAMYEAVVRNNYMFHNELVNGLKSIAAEVPGGLRIVDLGCGDSWLATSRISRFQGRLVPGSQSPLIGNPAGAAKHCAVGIARQVDLWQHRRLRCLAAKRNCQSDFGQQFAPPFQQYRRQNDNRRALFSNSTAGGNPLLGRSGGATRGNRATFFLAGSRTPCSTIGWS